MKPYDKLIGSIIFILVIGIIVSLSVFCYKYLISMPDNARKLIIMAMSIASLVAIITKK